MITNVDLYVAVRPAVTAAAENDLYRICGTAPTEWRTRAGDPIEARAALTAVACGLLGEFAAPEEIDGEWVKRLDLSEYGLDWWLRQTAV